MRIEIEKKKRQSCILLDSGETRREKKKEKITIGDKPTTICCHAPHHMKEDMVVRLMR